MSRWTLNTTREPYGSIVIGSSAHLRQCIPNRALPFQRADDEQEPATAGTGHLGACCSGGQCLLDRLVDLRVRNARGERPFHLPALVHRDADGLNVAAAKPIRRFAGQVAQLGELGQPVGSVRGLLARIVFALRVIPV